MFLRSEALNGRSGHEVGRLLLQQLYAQVVGELMPNIAVTPLGKPYFESGVWHFSISHTKNHVFCVLSQQNVGLDAEEIGRKVSPAMLSHSLSDKEKERLGDNPQDAFLRLWVLKEAEAKRTGRGVGNWMKETDFHPFDERIQIIDGCYVAVLEDNHAI